MRINFIMLFGILIVQSGCGSFGHKMKSWLSGSESTPKESSSQEMRYSRQKNTGTPIKRNYGRMNKEKLEREAHLESQSGSLWVMEGQGAYLFSENIMRMVGDSINVRLDGAPRKQVETKVAVIKKLLKRLYQPPPPMRSLASTSNKGKKKKAGKKDTESKNEGEEKKENSEGENAVQAQNEEMNRELEKSEFEVEAVSSKIIERMADGNYKIRGSESFMIGNREYKVMVSGIVRSEDFSIEGISASQLLDPTFDVVSLRRNVRQ